MSALLVDQLVGCMSASAQQINAIAAASASSLPLTADDLIRQMANSATVIFVGDVVEVRRRVASSGSPQDIAEDGVEIDFLVDLGVRGSQARAIYTLREWAGLWAGGTDRYRPGQRFLMFLRKPATGGFSSPVHGFEGAIPLRGVGRAPGPYDNSSSAAEWMVDIRWLQAQTLKAQVHLSEPLRGFSPRRGSKRFHSETAVVEDVASPLLVHAITAPWLEINVPTAPTESLSHVLDFCIVRVDP